MVGWYKAEKEPKYLIKGTGANLERQEVHQGVLSQQFEQSVAIVSLGYCMCDNLNY